MNISLTPELEEFVAKKIESGMYQTASEVVRESLRLLRAHDDLDYGRLEDLRKALAIGIKQAEEGKVKPLNAKKTLARVRKRRQAQGQKKR